MSFIHFNPAMNFEEYKFQYVYEFAQIIQTVIECETMFWNYDESLALEAVTHFRKISLLHIYIYSHDFYLCRRIAKITSTRTDNDMQLGLL